MTEIECGNQPGTGVGADGCADGRIKNILEADGCLDLLAKAGCFLEHVGMADIECLRSGVHDVLSDDLNDALIGLFPAAALFDDLQLALVIEIQNGPNV